LEPEPVDPATQELFDLGHALEPVIAARYTAMTGRAVRRRRHLLIHPDIPWMGASLDRVSSLRGDRRIVELKWVPNRRWSIDGPEPVPAYVQDQVQWQLAVTGYDVAEVAVLAGDHVDVHEIGPNASYQADLLYLGRDFYGYVGRGERPTIDGSESTAETIRRLRPRDTLGLMEPTVEVAALAHAIRDATLARKAAVEEDSRLRSEMRWLLDEHSGVEDDDYRIHFRRSADRTVVTADWRSIAGAYRSLLELDEPYLDAIEAAHSNTDVVEGRRSLIPKFRDADTGKWF
jgi:putative phage-type endonuclease